MATSSITFSKEFFNKESLIKELVEFEQTAMSIGASQQYVDGIQAVINRLERRPIDYSIK